MIRQESNRAVFLDRDGVLIRSFMRDGVPHPPQTLDEVEILPGVADALTLLAARGILRIVVTNQPDVVRGTQTRQGVRQINDLLSRTLPLTEIYTCWHDDTDACACRKPAPGLLLEAARTYHLDTRQCFMVGDRWSDVEAGRAVGSTTFLIAREYSRRERCRPDHLAADLPEAVCRIIELLETADLKGENLA